jgi:ribonuclease Z
MQFSVRILGAGSATPTLGRHPSAQLITYHHEHFLIDCGEGTQYRLLEAKARMGKLNTIFISHLHGDHYFGLMPLLSSLNMGGRTEPLRLFGPFGLDTLLTAHFEHSKTPLNFQIVFTALESTTPYQIFENQYLTVETIPLYHRVPCTGFLFKEKPRKRSIITEKLPDKIDFEYIKALKDGQDVTDDAGNILYKTNDITLQAPPQRSYAYCSDTRYDERVAACVAGTDMMYHEATFCNELAHQAADRYHATAQEAGTIAQKAGVGKLLIGHFSSRYKEFSTFLSEAQAVFFNTAIATEGQEFLIEDLIIDSLPITYL